MGQELVQYHEMNMMNKIIISIILLMFIGNLVFAQKSEILLNYVGYGETTKEVYFTIHNSGDVKITDISVLVDEKEFKTIEAILPPKEGLQTFLYLDPGEHLIEVKTPEGAYDSLNINIPSALEKPYFPPEKTFLERNRMLLGIAILVVIFVIIAWLIKEKPRLKLK